MRQLAFTSAVPMVGFGAMDNFVMIQAGELIDVTIGVTFGLSTLTAAACGQIFSDVSGVCFGGTVDALAARLGLPVVNITAQQRASRQAKFASTSGAAVGVILGCCIGMTSLLFMDVDRAERLKREQEMDTMFRTVVIEGAKVLEADRTTLWMVDHDRRRLWSKVFNKQVFPTELAGARNDRLEVSMEEGIAGWVARTGQSCNVPDAYTDHRFNPDVDAHTKFRTHSILAEPVIGADGTVVAVVQALNKAGDAPFTDNDEKLLKMMAAHVAVFMRVALKQAA